jgi:hypothetical protein
MPALYARTVPMKSDLNPKTGKRFDGACDWPIGGMNWRGIPAHVEQLYRAPPPRPIIRKSLIRKHLTDHTLAQ